MTMTHPAGSARAVRWVVLGAMAASLGMLVLIVASLLLPGRPDLPNPPDPLGVICFSAVFFTFPAVGGFIALRRPRHPIGWMFLVIGLGMTMSIFSTEYAVRAVFEGWPLPAPDLVAWAGLWSFLPSTALALTLVPLLFPDGRFLGPVWRALGWFAGAWIVVGSLGMALPAGPIAGTDGRILNPIALPPELADLSLLVGNVAFAAIALLGIASLSSLAVRFRRGGQVERAQLKWFVSAVAAFLVVMVGAFVSQVNAAFTLAVGFLAMIPIATGIAILRYRLFDIDRIVSRTVGWLLVTLILVGLFGGGILVAQALLEPVTGGSTVGVAISTLVVAASFSPVRSRVQRAVDRRFNRARYDAERTAGAFAGRLRDEVDLETIATDLAGTVHDTLAPASVSVWVKG